MKKITTIVFPICLIILSINAKSSEINSINLFSGDVHNIVNADESGLIKKYNVFSLNILLKGFGDDWYKREISFMKGLSSIMDKSKYDFSSENPSERKVVAQKAFDDFSKAHGKSVSEKTKMIPARDYRGKVKQVVYEFKKENGYTPSIALEWSNTIIEGKKYYYIDVIEAHMKY